MHDWHLAVVGVAVDEMNLLLVLLCLVLRTVVSCKCKKTFVLCYGPNDIYELQKVEACIRATGVVMWNDDRCPPTMPAMPKFVCRRTAGPCSQCIGPTTSTTERSLRSTAGFRPGTTTTLLPVWTAVRACRPTFGAGVLLVCICRNYPTTANPGR